MNIIIMEAAEHDYNLTNAPNKSVLELLEATSELTAAASCRCDGLLAAPSLSEVQPGPYGGLTIASTGRQAAKIMALVFATRPAKQNLCGEGFRLVSQGVVDAVSTDPIDTTSQQFTCTQMSSCIWLGDNT